MDDTAGSIAPGTPVSVDPPHTVSWSLRLGILTVGTTLAMAHADLALGGLAAPAFEELLNARAALLTACGHGLELPVLQYRAFCGGCTADALLGAAPLRLLGGTVGAWKLVPVGLHAIASAALVVLAGAGGGRRGAWVALALVLGAPTAWRELVLTGWGNHAESMAFTFGAAALLLGAERRPWTAGAAGVVAGVGVWYAWISAHALPALGLAALCAGGRRGLLAFGLGMPVGVAPLAGFVAVRPEARPELLDLGSRLSPAPIAAWLAWWSEPFLPGRSWLHGDGLLRWVGAAATGVVAGLACLGLASVRQIRGRGRVGPVLVGGGLLGLGIATLLRHDLWADNPMLMGFDPFALRYRAPALPLVLLGAALASVRSRVAAGLALAVAAFGLQQRVGEWWSGEGLDLGAPLEVTALAPDPTVPEGTPPRRNPDRMSRPVDIDAARSFLDGHVDGVPACRAVHAAELGRRMGLRDARQGCPSPPESGPDAVAVALGHAQACPL